MANERTYPCLPCSDIDQAIAFYAALGFTRTYRQVAPNPYAVVRREDLHIHLFGMPGFDPAQSYGSVIVVVPDADALYADFAAGLRQAYGRIPISGFPRITRPRKKYGTVSGFSVVDVGGNWLRISKLGDMEQEPKKPADLPGVVELAARLGDAHGDEALALRTLEKGLERYTEAAPIDRARALLYLAELAARVGDRVRAEAALTAALGLPLSDDERVAVAAEAEQVADLVRDHDRPPG